MALSVNDFTAGTVITASAMNTNFATIENYVNSSPGMAGLTGATFTGTVTINAALAVSGATTYTNTIEVGVSGTGHDLTCWGDTAGDYMHWDADTNKLLIVGTAGSTALEVQEGHVVIDDNLTVTTGTSALKVTNIVGALTVGVSDTGHNVYFYGATANKYLKWDQANDRLQLGDSGGSKGCDILAYGATDTKLMQWDESADTFKVVGAVEITGALSKSSGSFDIAHPTKGGDWRLRHSFIEGPTADNIYRGTVTISGDSVSVDLDAVSGMTDGTWEALNTNPWSMVSSSGNCPSTVTWSLSGKTLTITGPDGAVCSWMVIGERKDNEMKDSTITDDTGKLIVEYE